MKNQIKISLAVLSALVISNDSQAMFRAMRSARPEMPRAQRAPQNPFILKKEIKPNLHAALMDLRENKFPLPKMPTHRIDREVIAAHDRLCLDWYLADQSARDEKRNLIKNTVQSPAYFAGTFAAILSMDRVPLVNAFMHSLSHEMGFAVFMGTLLGGSAMTATKMTNAIGNRWIYKDEMKQKKSIETKLAELMKEQKREIALADDIQ